MDVLFLIVFLVAHLLPNHIQTAQLNKLEGGRVLSSITIEQVKPNMYEIYQKKGEVRKFKVEKEAILDHSAGGKTDMKLFLDIPSSATKWQKIKSIKAVDEPSDIYIRRKKNKIYLSQKEGSYSEIFPFEITWK